MEHERLDPELDDLLNDIHRLIDEEEPLAEMPQEQDLVGEFDFTGLFDEVTVPTEDGASAVGFDSDFAAEFDETPEPDMEPEFDLDFDVLSEEAPEAEPAAEPAPEPEPAPLPTPEKLRWTDKQKLPKHVAKLQKNQEQAYADWLYAQENAEPVKQPESVQVPESIRELGPTRWTDRQKVPRHVAKLQQNQKQAYEDWLYEQGLHADDPAPVFPVEEEDDGRKKKEKKKQKKQKQEPVPEPVVFEKPKKKKHGFRNFLIFLVVLTLAVSCVVAFLLPEKPVGAGSAGRKSGVSTILVVGTDAGGARTDTLMLLSVNRTEGTISLVSIPRDTLVNGNYTVPKINSVYGANNGGYEGMEMLMTRVKQCIGFEPDGYILLQLDAFVEFVDVLGGVEFDVPVDMFYNDPSQNLHIALEAGKQMLTGEEALGVVRFRSGYADADLGRVQVQRDFLSALIRQAVSPEGILKSPLLLGVLQNHTQTDLNARNFLWLAETVLLADRSHVDTVTLPGSARNWESGSYYVLDPDAVAQTVNTYCNPFVQDVTPEDLEIRTN